MSKELGASFSSDFSSLRIAFIQWKRIHEQGTSISRIHMVFFNASYFYGRKSRRCFTYLFGRLSEGVEYHMYAKEAIIKTFEIDNMVIDCVDVYKQPAFQHPLLVNHTLQLKSNHPEGKTNDFATEASHPWNSSRSCPKGYIPIERIKGSTGDNLKLHSHKFPNLQDQESVREHSVIRASNNPFFGGKATLNVWNPKVDSQSDFSTAQVWITTDSFLDWLEVGWTVYPGHFGTSETRFFIYRTGDNYRTTGCYNLDCPGFVQTNQHSLLGPVLQPVSQYGGEQYTVDIEVFQDKTSGNWWVRLNGADMGYWPKEIVPSLAKGANIVDFGGDVALKTSKLPHPSTEMGSGHFPSEGLNKASFIRNIQVLDSSDKYQTHGDIQIIKDNKGCYDLQVGLSSDGPWGLFFYFGGSGSSNTCTSVAG